MSYFSKSQNNVDESIIWPGFVDVLASTLMVIIFIVLLFTVSQVYLGDLVVGKNEQIQNLEKTIEIQDDTILEQDISLTDKEKILIEKQNIISQLDSEILNLDEEIKAKKELILNKDQQLSSQDQIILNQDQTIFSLDELISEQALDIDELNKIIAQITDELSISLAQNKELQSELSNLNEEQKQLKINLLNLEGSNEVLIGKITESQSKIETLIQTLNSSETLNKALEERIASTNEQNEALKNQISSLEGDAEIKNANLNDALVKIAQLSENIKILGNEILLLNNLLESKEVEIAQNKVELGELGDRLNRVLTSEIYKLQKYKSEFFGKLAEILGDRSDIQIKGDRFIFQSEVLFESGSSDIQPEGRAALSLIAKTMNDLIIELPTELNWILQVDGHTDKVPIATSRYPSNWELSHSRALEVVKFFIQQGLPANKLSANGYGEYQPINFGDRPEDLKQNRRIELKITQN